MEEDRIKWDARYGREGYMFSFTPSKFLARSFETLLALVPGRRALDIACGEGRNGIFLAQNGFEVTAVDISPVGLAKGMVRASQVGVRVDFVCADLDTYRVEQGYDLILDFNFLFRPLIPMMVEALTPGGVILMETVLKGPNLPGEHRKEYLLGQGELEGIFTRDDGEILLVEEDHSGDFPVARVMFRKTG